MEAAIAPNQETEFAGERLAESYERAFAVVMLESQALRSLALGSIFAAASLFIVVAGIWYYVQYGWSQAFVPVTVLSVVLAIAVVQLGLRQCIKNHIRQNKFVPRWVWYAITCIEITAMTALMAFVHDGMSNPVFALSMPPLLGYFLFIVLSTLYLDVRLSLFTGTLAALQYLALVSFVFLQFGSNPLEDARFLTPAIYFAKAFILFVGGAAAAFVAWELKRRQSASLEAAEDRDREQRANALKSQFLADMSHEIRTPLNSVVGYAQLLEVDQNITQEQRKAVEAIQVGGKHLLSVVNDVLDISKIEAGSEAIKPSRFDLNVLLQELTLIFAARCAEKELSWIFDSKADIGHVAGDEAKLRQVLTNILGNAVKFTETGHVALRVTAGDGNMVTFEIEDTGPGISKEKQNEIFDPFSQDTQGRLSGGTGLGLTIAQRYVGMMGGRVTIESSPSDGARFRFSVPLAQVSGNRSSNVSGPDWPEFHLGPGQQVQALVADDLPENREILKQMLELFGITVLTVNNGKEALFALKESNFVIAFLDIRMPQLTGMEIVRELANAAGERPKLVAVSASALAHQRAEYISAGFDEFLHKPVELDSLFATLDRLLDVEFIHTSPESSDPVSCGKSSEALVPDRLRAGMKEAARRQNITDLKFLISEFEGLGAEEKILAGELRQLCRSYDMKAVLSLLEGQDGG